MAGPLRFIFSCSHWSSGRIRSHSSFGRGRGADKLRAAARPAKWRRLDVMWSRLRTGPYGVRRPILLVQKPTRHAIATVLSGNEPSSAPTAHVATMVSAAHIICRSNIVFRGRLRLSDTPGLAPGGNWFSDSVAPTFGGRANTDRRSAMDNEGMENCAG